MSEGQILVIEGDRKLQRLLEGHLAARNYAVQVCGSIKEGSDALARHQPDAVLLDTHLPDGYGLDFCRDVRRWSSVPIILLMADDSPQEKVDALEMGADDSVTKPFHMGELIARIRAVQRRTGPMAPVASIVEAGPLRIDLPRRAVTLDGAPVHLTKIEFGLLAELIKQPETVMSYEHLLNAVWGSGYTDVRPVHVHICNLRRKIEPEATGRRYVVAIPGVGYRFRLEE